MVLLAKTSAVATTAGSGIRHVRRLRELFQSVVRLQECDQVSQLRDRQLVVVDSHFRFAILFDIVGGVSDCESVRWIDDRRDQVSIRLDCRRLTAKRNHCFHLRCMSFKFHSLNAVAGVALQLHECLLPPIRISVRQREPCARFRVRCATDGHR